MDGGGGGSDGGWKVEGEHCWCGELNMHDNFVAWFLQLISVL